MFSQKKEYIQLFRGNEKLMTAGLCKLIIWDQKIKIDYYMDHLPIGDHTEGTCHLIYLVRKEGEQNLLQRETTFPFLFLKSQFHYAIQTHETAEHKIVKIENCYIELAEQVTEPDLAEQNTSALEEEQTGEESSETSGEKIHASEKIPDDNKPGRTDYPVRRIDDLKELLSMGEEFVELYYNSFLLHSFYQYRHLLLGKDFLAVPGYFYEREAIAAKMMGFPYFIEAQYVDHCNLAEGKRMKKPVDGTYGYFIRATAS